MKHSVVPKGAWEKEAATLRYVSGETVVFEDSLDHWTNGVCRLLGIPDEIGRKWVEKISSLAHTLHGCGFSALDYEARSEVIRHSVLSVFGDDDQANNRSDLLGSTGRCGHQADVVWSSRIGNIASVAVVGCGKCRHGWLISTNEPKRALTHTVLYEKEYFEGAEQGLGYGNYIAQSDWRIKKSRRLLRQIVGARQYLGCQPAEHLRALDLGSGYGFFRKALDEAGWEHDGVELSTHAISVCQKEFNFSTYNGTVETYSAQTDRTYDLITLWDTLEHVSDPESMLKSVRKLLGDAALCAIRTPNLMALEREVLGSFYYSFKQEHLHYFSPYSIIAFLEKAGLYPVFMTTESHFFRGFFGKGIHSFEKTLRGSDLFILAAKS